MEPIRSFSDIQKYQVNRSQEFEVTRQTLYDFQTYANAGQTSLTFFQIPIGQSGKTIADTNLELAGQLPAPKHFVVESIEVVFYPGPLPVEVDTAVTDVEHVNDVYTVAKSGSLNFFIGSKSYLQEAPIGRFPPKTRLDADFGFALQQFQATAADAVSQVSGNYAAMSGRPYFLSPYNIALMPTQNFNVSLTWPSAVALPSGVDGRIGIVLDGALVRLSQ